MNNKTKLSTRVLLALLLMLPFSFAPRARAQSGAKAERPSQFVMPLHGEGFIAFKVEAAPIAAAAASSAPKISVNLGAIQAALAPQVLLAEGNVVHRVLVDAGGNFVFGYDLVVEPVAASKQFKVSIKPLSAEFEEQLRSRQQQQQQPAGAAAPLKQVSTLPRATDAQLIDDGDAFALDLLVNAETGVKIMDVVKVSFDRAKLWSAPQQRSVPLRDFTLGNVELAVREYKLTLNGELISGGKKPARGFTGALLWFYVPERGRFIVSLMPHEGYDFQKIGRIENNKMSFKLGDDLYEWTSSAPVVGNGGNWNLWVLHDPAYVSDFASQEQIVAGTAAAAAAAGDTSPSSEWLQETLRRARKREAEFETRDPNAKRNPARPPRVLVGGADRIENLLPKH